MLGDSLPTRVPLQLLKKLLHPSHALSLFLASADDRRKTRDRDCSAVGVVVPAKPKDSAATGAAKR